MIFVGYARLKPEHVRDDFGEKSQTWWKERRPKGLKFLSAYGSLGATPDVFVVDTNDHQDIAAMVQFWYEFEFDLHPAYDLLDTFRQQGMPV
jgi:hypothetical protein